MNNVPRNASKTSRQRRLGKPLGFKGGFPLGQAGCVIGTLAEQKRDMNHSLLMDILRMIRIMQTLSMLGCIGISKATPLILPRMKAAGSPMAAAR